MSLTRGDSTYNLLMDLSPPEVVEPCSGAGGGGSGGGGSGTLSTGINSPTPTASSLSGGNRLQKQSRPLLTAPSFEQRPPDLHDSPWSSTETSCRSRKSSGTQDLAGSTNNNTLAIAISNSIARQCTNQSQGSVESNSNRNRSVPDIELHYRRGNSDDRVCVISGESPRMFNRHASPHFAHHYHHHTQPAPSRPRVCEHQPFSFSLSRATSRESIRSVQPTSTTDSLQLPTAVLTPQHRRESRGMLRQHSQPETSCFHCQVSNASSSLRQLKEANTGDAIAGIAADTLRINGAIRQFRQVVFPVGHLTFYFHFHLLLLAGGAIITTCA